LNGLYSSLRLGLLLPAPDLCPGLHAAKLLPIENSVRYSVPKHAFATSSSLASTHYEFFSYCARTNYGFFS